MSPVELNYLDFDHSEDAHGVGTPVTHRNRFVL